MTFQLFMMGGEQAGWQRLLLDQGATNLGISYWGLKRRMAKTKPYLFVEKIDPKFSVFVDSGGYSANKTAATVSEWEEYAEGYKRFVEANVNELEMVTEFDCLALGPQWIAKQRDWWEQAVPAEKFLPIWHAADGLPTLDKLAQEYERVGIPENALEEHGNLAGLVNGMRQKYGTRFHAIASAKPDDLKAVHFDSAATSSWLSPARYGETIIWDGVRLHRYPKHMKDQARRRHRQLFDREGFNLDLIAEDDSNEMLRVAVWSFLQLEAQVGKHRPQIADKHDGSGDENSGSDALDVDNTGASMRNAELVAPAAAPTPRDPSERRLLPVVGFNESTSSYINEEGETVTDTAKTMRLAPASQRRCDTCYIQQSCPAMKPGAECAFDIPVELRSKDQMLGALQSVLEMQVQRVAFMRLTEELNGGYADPNLSQEMDRFYRLVEQLKKIQDDSSFFRVQVEAREGAGVLSRIFGAGAVERGEKQGLDAGQTNRFVAGALEGEVVRPTSGGS